MRCPKFRFQIWIIVFDELELIIFVSQGLTLSTASLVFLQQTVCCDPGFPSFDCILWHFATKIKTSNICCKCQHWPSPGQSLLFFVRFRVQRIAIKGRWSQIKKQCPPIQFKKIIDSSFSDFKWLIKYVCRAEIECGQWGGLHIFCLNKKIDSWPEIWERRCQNTTRWGYI